MTQFWCNLKVWFLNCTVGPYVFLLWDVRLGVGWLLMDLLVTLGISYLDPIKSNQILNKYTYFLYGSRDNHRESLFIIHGNVS